MPFVSKRELSNLKLQTISLTSLQEFVREQGLSSVGTKSDLVLRLVDIDPVNIDEFIRRKYKDIVMERQKKISDNHLKEELSKVTSFKWSTVQGQLDRKIQSELVRVYPRYEDLIKGIESKLYNDVKGYVLASWYNHWTTILIEDHIALHKNVVPTLTSKFGIDLFFDNQPFDLKITNLPRDYDYSLAVRDPHHLIKWLYENQGAQRFGDDNRMFIVLASKLGIEGSWKLKREFDFIFSKINKFLNETSVTEKDEIGFSFERNTYTVVSKLLLITDQ